MVLPYTRIGVVGGIMLGLGRALGETMAVTFVIGNAHRISASILQPGTTISAALANEFTEADSDHLPVVADSAGLHPVHHHLYRARDRQGDAAAVAKAGGELIRWGSMPVASWPTRVVMSLAVVATAFGLMWLVLVLWTLLVEGISAITPALFSQMTPPPGNSGGLLNPIFGSLVMTLIATLIGTPTGILAGTFLAEYSRGGRFGEVVRFLNDILLSAPSIIIGLFVYEIMVVPMGHFSAWAGAVALAIIVIPVVVRTTEDMLNLVPTALREAASALGAPKWKVIVMVSYRAAIQGMLTGVMLAVARIAGETAPLLFTALNNQFWSNDLNAPMANLPVVIFQFAMSPYADWQTLAWGGALLITVTVLFLNIGARVLASWSTFKP